MVNIFYTKMTGFEMDSFCVYRAARTEYLIVIQVVLVFEGLTLFLPLFQPKLDGIASYYLTNLNI
jgi:hypothetical protein